MHGIFLSSIVSTNTRKFSIMRALGPYRLASHLRENGYDIQVIEFVHLMEDQHIEKLLHKFITPKTKFIGLGFMINLGDGKYTYYMNRFTRLFLKIKEQFPQLKIIIGGSTAPMWSSRYQNKEVFDYIINGYGEDQTLALFNHHYKGTPHPPFEIKNGNKHLSENLIKDKLFNFTTNMHRWHKSDCIQHGEALPIEFARGCIFKCTFCKYPHIGKHKNDYTKHIEYIEEELLYNYNNFGTTTYYVTDDTFNADTDFIKSFTDMAKSLPFKLQYGAYLRPDLLHGNPETEDMFLENGLYVCFFGIETFHPDNAKIVGKPWSAKHGKDYLKYIYHDKWKRKIGVTSSLIAGLPNETLEELKDVNKWFSENELSSWIWHPLHVSRSSDSYKSEFDINAEKYGFQFNIVEGKSRWQHSTCDELLAIDWTIELTNDIRTTRSLVSWGQIELTTYRYDQSFNTNSITMKMHEFDWVWIDGRAREILIKYYKDLLAL